MIMKKFFLILITLCFLSCGKESEYQKSDALIQSEVCLRIKQELGHISNVRNPYLSKLSKTINNGSIPSKKLTDEISRLTVEMDDIMIYGEELIKKLKPIHHDTPFFDATQEYLKFNKELERKSTLLIKKIINLNSDENELSILSKEVVILAKQLEVKQTEYLQKESIFHNDNLISQQEVDSMVRTIKNK